MENNEFKYKKVKGGYVLEQDYSYQGLVKPCVTKKYKFFTIEASGLITIKKGYFWNGATGIPDTRFNIRASLVHDAYWQAMALELLCDEKWRRVTDRVFTNIMIEDNMHPWFAELHYVGLRVFGMVKFGN